MADTKPIPVRLSAETAGRLDAAAKKTGITRAAIMRFLVDTWSREFELKGEALLPVNWEEMLRKMDGRRTESKTPTIVVADPNSSVPSAASKLLKSAAAKVKKTKKPDEE